MLLRLLSWLTESPEVNIPIFSAVVALVGIVIGGFLNSIVWPRLSRGLDYLTTKLSFIAAGRSFEEKYLSWVEKAHRNLPILPTTLVPVAGRHQKEMDKLYVGLALKEGTRQVPVRLKAALIKSRKLVLLGEPGAGKTTTLRFLALMCARANQSRHRDTAGKTRSESARKTVEGQFGLGYYPFPIFLYLNRLLKDQRQGPSGAVRDAILDSWNAHDLFGEVDKETLHRYISCGRCIFLLDAFDELASKDARENVARDIGELAEASHPNTIFLVSSRIAGYSGQLEQYDFHTVIIERLSEHLIEELVSKWHRSLGCVEKTGPLLADIHANSRILELSANPMLLSLVVLVQYVRGLIPDKRHILYDECIKILVERRFAPARIQRKYNKLVQAEEVVRLLQEIAHAMHNDNRREVTKQELVAKLIPEIVSGMELARCASVSPEQIVENIQERSEILVERGFDQYGEPLVSFSHLTFQEYLVSTRLLEQATADGVEEVTSQLLRSYIVDQKWWEEVALLYAARLRGEQRTDFIMQLYPARGVNVR